MDIHIDKSVPPPKRLGEGIVEAMKKMKIGESFLVPLNCRHHVYNSATCALIRVMIRKEGNMLRVWRISPKGGKS